VGIQRWPVYRRLRVGAAGAMPRRVSATAMTLAGDVSDEDLATAELMTGWAMRWSFRDPRARQWCVLGHRRQA
jgi:hypothetical protein